MATITLKNIPDPTYKTLKQLAAENRRSINSEVIHLIEKATKSKKIDPGKHLLAARKFREKTKEYIISDLKLTEEKNEARSAVIVVDTNVISYLYLSSEYSELAEQLFLKNSSWSAPILWRSEFRNVLSFYIRKEILTLQDAIQIFEAAESLFNQNEYEINSFQVLKLSQKSGCSAYDCEFVNLAQDLNVPLVTMDKKLLRSFQGTAVSIETYLEKY